MSILLYPIGFFVYIFLIHPYFSRLPAIIFVPLTYGMFIIWFFTDNIFITYWNYFISFPVVATALLSKLKIIK